MFFWRGDAWLAMEMRCGALMRVGNVTAELGASSTSILAIGCHSFYALRKYNVLQPIKGRGPIARS